jgi:hypothetical protein
MGSAVGERENPMLSTVKAGLKRAPRAVAKRGSDAVFDIATRVKPAPSPSGKTVILHPGLRKTATTTIQAMMSANAGLIGDHVAVVQRFSTPSMDEMHRAGHLYANDPGPETARAVRRAARRMDAAIRSLPQPVVILSDENVAGRVIYAQGRDIFDLVGDVLAIFEDEFAGHEIKVALGTRSRDRWLRSCWNQDVKRHKFTGDFDAWMVRNGACRDHEAGIRDVRDRVSAEVHEMPMERDLEPDRVLGQTLLEIAGLPAERIAALRPAPHRNPSLDTVQLDLIREINGLDLPFGVTSRIVDVILSRRDLLRVQDDGARSERRIG